MHTLNEFLTFEHESEHVLEHNLLVKKLFSNPKIYIANGDLSKRWYVYFSFRNPKTGKLERMKNIYGIVNNYKSKEDRLSILTMYRRNLLSLLKEGYNPFVDNSGLYKNRIDKLKDSLRASNISKAKNKEMPLEEIKMTLKEAFAFGLKLKEKLISSTTKVSYKNRVVNCLKWIEENHPEISTIDNLNKKIVNKFLNHILDRTSPRNRNNYRGDLSSIIQTLEDNDVIENNFIKKIPVLKSIPKRNKTYTVEIQKNIYSYLKDKDPILLLYIKFISYNFLRPIEVCRLRIGDVNLSNKTVQFKAKNSPLKTKIIPEILINALTEISKMDKKLFLFTPDKIGGEWNTNETNKRNYFSKRFKKVVKYHFDLGEDYGLYSFRHTYITKLYRKMVEKSTPFAAKSKLMLITGHTSMVALQKYLRDIDAELPEDYSEMLK